MPRERTKHRSKRTTVFDRARTPLLWLAAVRVALGVIVIPFVPFLYKEHFLVLVLLRPTKEVLLAGGLLARKNDIDLLEVTLVALPLLLFGVWHFFALGRAYADDIGTKRLPWIGGRLLKAERIKQLQKALKRKGAPLVIVGRLAIFPSTLLGAAAGASDMPSRRFFPADAAGAALSMVEVIGVGFLLGGAYEKAGPWLTAGGVVALLGFMFGLGWFMKRA